MMKKNMFWRMLFLGACLLTALTVAGQSGRSIKKTPRPQPTPEATVPTPTPTPTPKPEVKPSVKFRVVSDIPLTVFSDFSRPEYMTRWVVERLENSSLVEIKSNVSGSQKKAKETAAGLTGEDEYVIYLQLNINSTLGGTGSRTSEGDVWIDYAVLLPQTGKNKFRDRVFVRQGVVSQSSRACYPSMRYADYMLLQASVEVAKRIMAEFSLPLPAEKCRSLL